MDPKRTIGAHRISWILHNGPIPDSLCVLHNCPGGDNPSCVNPAHLWLGDRRDNNLDMFKKGTCPHAEGEKNWAAKLTAEKVKEMRKLKEAGMGFRRIANRFSIHKTTARDACRGKTWAHVH